MDTGTCSLRSALRNGSCSSCPFVLMFAPLFLVLITALYCISPASATGSRLTLAAPFIVGINPLPEFYFQRRSHQFKRITEEMFKIAAVAVGNAVEPGAVNDDARRIAAALMRITHFGTENSATRRRLAGNRGLQCP